jgi:PAS domain S-box-containing protein
MSMSDRKPSEPGAQGKEVPHVLWEREEHFRQLVEGVEDYAIFLLDDRGYVTTWNLGARRIKGFTSEDILGKHFSTFYTQDAIASGLPEHELRVAAKEGRFEDEGWRVRKDGPPFWANVVITAMRAEDGTLRGFLKITRDLTRRKDAEEALRLSEERFRLLVEGVHDYAIFMLSPQGYVASWNAGAERIKGYKAEEIIGKHFSYLYSPEAIAQGKPEQELRAAVEHGRIEDEGWRVRKDGQKFWANVVITALRDKEGRLRAFAKVTRDLTDRRRIEELQEADRLKNEFLALLAHELRNPLAPIRSALHVLGQAGASPADVRRSREIAERQVRHMARLLDDLLDVALISQGQMELRPEVIDLASVVSRAVEAVRPLIQQRRQDLTVSVPPGSLWIEADASRLEQILTNLLNNAVKYTDAGGRIWLTGEPEGENVLLRVRDSGIGIEPVLLPGIFDLFFRADRRLDRSAAGVGVGLTLVKKLVELHGGTVEALSPGRGKGSEFVVRLPRAGIPRAEEPLAEDESPSADQRALRVLVVDDNVDAADGLAMLLRLNGEQVRVAYDGPTALMIAREFRPQVALLDIGMPHMDGYQVARRLRQEPATRQALLVALTGWGQLEDLRKTKEAGFDHHLVKPTEPARVEKLLADLKATRPL